MYNTIINVYYVPSQIHVICSAMRKKTTHTFVPFQQWKTSCSWHLKLRSPPKKNFGTASCKIWCMKCIPTAVTYILTCFFQKKITATFFTGT